MTPEEKDRLITFFRNKMCAPCRNSDGNPNPDHSGCVEAQELLEVIQREP